MARYTTVTDNWRVGRLDGLVQHKHQHTVYVMPTQKLLPHELVGNIILEYDYLTAKKSIGTYHTLPVTVNYEFIPREETLDARRALEQEIAIMLTNILETNTKAAKELDVILADFIAEVDEQYRHRSRKTLRTHT